MSQTLRNTDEMASLETPCFIIDEMGLDAGVHKLGRSLQDSWGNYLIGYSYKTNALPWIVSHMNELGCCAEVVSDDEYSLAMAIGVKPEFVIYNGIAKSKKTFLHALENGAIVNLDASYEIDWLDDCEGEPRGIGIRVNFDLESRCPGHAHGGSDGSRFGFCYENGELKRAIDLVSAKGFSISGLHLHKSTKTRMPDPYFAMAEVACEIAGEYGLSVEYVDIGGGFFGGLSSKPQFPEYFGGVSEILHRQFSPEKVKLIVEPGMALIGPAVSYVTKVLDVKRGRTVPYVCTNGSRIHVDPLMTKSSYFYEAVRASSVDREMAPRQVVVGFTCMENDRLFEIEDEPELRQGDLIVYGRVGAYTMCLSPSFIKWQPSVYIQDQRERHMVRASWNTTDYLAANVITAEIGEVSHQ